MCASGRLQSFVTPGGHRRIPLAELEATREGTSDQERSANYSPPQPSAIRQKKERIEELNLTIQERKAKATLSELDQEERSRAQREEAEQQARQQEERRARSEAEAEIARRRRERKEAERQEHAERKRRRWESQWLTWALTNVPSAATLDVQHAVRQTLTEMYGHADDVVATAVRATLESALRPWGRAQDATAAANEAPKELSPLAKGYRGTQSEWEIRAKEYADDAIAKLPETATLEQMLSAARTAGKRANAEYQHDQRTDGWIASIGQHVARTLPSARAEEKVTAEAAVRAAFERLPIGASSPQFETARDVALEPFVAGELQRKAERQAAEAKAQADREAAERKAQLEREADTHLYRVSSYLSELEANPDGWDFEGKLYQYAQQIQREIRANLIEDLPLDFTSGRQRVEELVRQWLADHWKSASELEA